MTLKNFVFRTTILLIVVVIGTILFCGYTHLINNIEEHTELERDAISFCSQKGYVDIKYFDYKTEIFYCQDATRLDKYSFRTIQ